LSTFEPAGVPDGVLLSLVIKYLTGHFSLQDAKTARQPVDKTEAMIICDLLALVGTNDDELLANARLIVVELLPWAWGDLKSGHSTYSPLFKAAVVLVSKHLQWYGDNKKPIPNWPAQMMSFVMASSIKAGGHPEAEVAVVVQYTLKRHGYTEGNDYLLLEQGAKMMRLTPPVDGEVKTLTKLLGYFHDDRYDIFLRAWSKDIQYRILPWS
jgi:hypothetical protein